MERELLGTTGEISGLGIAQAALDARVMFGGKSSQTLMPQKWLRARLQACLI
jgi:hypothetical protein